MVESRGCSARSAAPTARDRANRPVRPELKRRTHSVSFFQYKSFNCRRRSSLAARDDKWRPVGAIAPVDRPVARPVGQRAQREIHRVAVHHCVLERKWPITRRSADPRNRAHTLLQPESLSKRSPTPHSKYSQSASIVLNSKRSAVSLYSAVTVLLGNPVSRATSATRNFRSPISTDSRHLIISRKSHFEEDNRAQNDILTCRIPLCAIEYYFRQHFAAQTHKM